MSKFKAVSWTAMPLVVALMATVAPVAAAEPAAIAEQLGGRAFTARDLANLDRISSPRISPDGRHAVYALRLPPKPGEPAAMVLQIIDLSDPGAMPRTVVAAGTGAHSPAWSADGTRIYYLSGKSGSQQVWSVQADGAQPRQLTEVPIDVGGFRFVPGADALIIAADVDPTCDLLACAKAQDEARANQVGHGTLIRSGPPRYGSSYEDEKQVGVFRVEIPAEGAARDGRRIVRDFGTDVSISEGSFFSSIDGKTLFFASLDPAVAKGGENARKLYVAPADGSAVPQAVLGGIGNSISGLAPSPDGKHLAYLATDGSIWNFGRTTVMTRDLATGVSREVTPGTNVMFTSLAWTADGRKLIATAEERGKGPLYEIDVSSGRLTRLEGEGYVADVGVAPGGMIFLRDSLRSPPQLFLRRGSSARQVTAVGIEVLAQTAMSPAEQFSFKGWNDETVYGYVVKPHGYVKGRRYPVAFLIHGGPQQSFGDSWTYRWNPQVWAGMGYAVVMIDFHGSTGYGTAFGRASIGHWHDRPLEDLQKGWAFALQKYPYLDGDRACALGGSYGGYMINWMASQWNSPWKCLVNHAGIFDPRFLKLTIGISAFVDAQLGQPSAAELDRISPGLQLDKWKVPMLITHGARDFLVPIDQGVSSYNAARAKGIPTQMLIFPDEGHQIADPANVVQWFQTIESWMARWLPPPN